MNVHSKPFEPDHALLVADVVRVKRAHNEIADCLSRLPDINTVLQSWKTVDLTEFAIAQVFDHNLTTLIHYFPANLNCIQMKVPDSDSLIWVDISTGAERVLVPECMCKQVFDQIHNLSYPGGKASIDLIKDCFYWENMKRDINRYVQNRVACQNAKVQRRNVTPLQQFKLPDQRIYSVHCDLVCKLPTLIAGFQYLLTIIDRYTRDLEVVPLKDTSAKTVADAFFTGLLNLAALRNYL